MCKSFRSHAEALAVMLIVLGTVALNPESARAARRSVAARARPDSQLLIFTAEALTSKPPFSLYVTPQRDSFHTQCKVCDLGAVTLLIGHIPRNLPLLINYKPERGQVEYVGLCRR